MKSILLVNSILAAMVVACGSEDKVPTIVVDDSGTMTPSDDGGGGDPFKLHTPPPGLALTLNDGGTLPVDSGAVVVGDDSGLVDSGAVVGDDSGLVDSGGGDQDGGFVADSGGGQSDSGGGLSDSGGVDQDASIPFRGCTYTQGYWKLHPTWPVSSLQLGSHVYSESDCMTLLNMMPQGDVSDILAKQLIAGLLNGGQNDPNASALIQQAQTWMSVNGAVLPYGITDMSSQVWLDGYNLGQALDSYNSGNCGGTPHCQ